MNYHLTLRFLRYFFVQLSDFDLKFQQKWLTIVESFVAAVAEMEFLKEVLLSLPSPMAFSDSERHSGRSRLRFCFDVSKVMENRPTFGRHFLNNGVECRRLERTSCSRIHPRYDQTTFELYFTE